MSHDFLVAPSGTTAAFDRLESLGGVGRGWTPGSAVGGFVEELLAANHAWVREPVTGTDEVAGFDTEGEVPFTEINALLELVRKHRVAVIDPQLGMTFDAAGAYDVKLSTDGGPEGDWVSPSVLAAVLELIADGMFPWVTLARGDQTYAQCYSEEGSGVWDVEYRAGGPDAHFAAQTEDRAVVEAVLLDWLAEGTSWRTALPFEPLDLG